MSQPKELGTLVVVVLKARHLHQPSFYKQDPYAQAALSGLTQKTKPDPKGGQHPVWDDEFRFPVLSDPGKDQVNRKLEVSCWKDEARGEDKLLGKGIVDIESTLKTGEFDDWVQLETESGGARGELYLEMTFYANAPPPVNRRPTKLGQSDRLARPQSYHSVPSKSGSYLSPDAPSSHGRPPNITPVQLRDPGYVSPATLPTSLLPARGQPMSQAHPHSPPSKSPSPNRHSPQNKMDTLPPLPEEADAPLSQRKPGHLPTVLRPGGRPAPSAVRHGNPTESASRSDTSTLTSPLTSMSLSQTSSTELSELLGVRASLIMADEPVDERYQPSFPIAGSHTPEPQLYHTQGQGQTNYYLSANSTPQQYSPPSQVYAPPQQTFSPPPQPYQQSYTPQNYVPPSPQSQQYSPPSAYPSQHQAHQTPPSTTPYHSPPPATPYQSPPPTTSSYQPPSSSVHPHQYQAPSLTTPYQLPPTQPQSYPNQPYSPPPAPQLYVPHAPSHSSQPQGCVQQQHQDYTPAPPQQQPYQQQSYFHPPPPPPLAPSPTPQPQTQIAPMPYFTPPPPPPPLPGSQQGTSTPRAELQTPLVQGYQNVAPAPTTIPALSQSVAPASPPQVSPLASSAVPTPSEDQRKQEEEQRVKAQEERARDEERRRADEARNAAEEADRLRKEAEEAGRLRKEAEEAEQRRKEAEEARRQVVEQERRRQEEEELKRKEIEEQKRREEEQLRLEAKKRQEEEERRRAEEQRQAEDARRKLEEEERHKREEEEMRMRLEEEAHRKREEEEQRKRKAEEEETRRRVEEAEAERRWQAELARIKARAEQEASDAAFARAQFEAEEAEHRKREEEDLAFARRAQQEAEQEQRANEEQRRQEELDRELARREQEHEEELERKRKEERRRQVEETDREMARKLDMELNLIAGNGSPSSPELPPRRRAGGPHPPGGW